jgi:hypothetical protein
MVTNYARSAYLFMTLSIITSPFHASSVSPSKLAQKLRALDTNFFRITGLAEKITPDDTHQAREAKIDFAQTIYNMQSENQNISTDPLQLAEKRKAAILQVLNQN